VAASAVPTGGGTLQLVSGLINNYYEAAATSSQGQETFQVIRVPQYASPTLGAVTALGWNGTVGGVAAMDVDGALALGGGSINVTSAWTAATPAANSGFRGGAALDMSGDAPGDLNSGTEYRISALAFTGNNAGGTAPGFGDGGSKGEGIAGTPMYVANSFSSLLQTSTTLDGYPNGSFDRGAPGNAGGGGTEADPPANDENTGGGGGGNGGAGGQGGYSWDTHLNEGGVGGAAFPASATQVVMGGGGGAPTENNEYTGGCQGGSPCEQYYGNGAPGGGIVIVRSGTVSGTGTVNVSGSTAYPDMENDGGAGGGAGGSIIFTTKTGTLPATLTLTANGGGGGNAWYNEAEGALDGDGSGYYVNEHGPGGGGGGGVILQSGGATASVTGGVHGFTTTSDLAFGSTSGAAGMAGSTTSASLPGVSSGAQCLASEVTISGYVYADVNHNGGLDPGESWASGPLVYVNLVKSGIVVQSVTVAAGGTGAYTFTNVPAGSYSMIVTNTATATTASAPSGWIPVSPTSMALSLTTSLTIGNNTYANQDFGFYHGLTMSGTVFKDNSGTNSGVWNASDPGISSVILTAKDSFSVQLDQETTNGGGNYTLWLPTVDSASNTVTSVTVTLTQIGGYTATGFQAGTPATGGTYNTTTLVFTVNPVWTNAAYTGVNFGFIQSGNIFIPNGQQLTVPGAIAIYAHQYASITGGTVTFTEAVAQSQPNYFNEILYNDTTCTGNLAAATYLAWGSAVTIPAGGGKVCLLMKENVSLAASYGMQNTVTITSTFSYGSSSSVANSTLTVYDLTTISTQTSGALQLVKSTYIDSACANPASPTYSTATQAAQSGYCIKYQIQATNGGASALTGLYINDTAPPYTTLQSGTAAMSVGTSCTGLTAGAITVTAPTVQAAFTGTMPSGCVATFVYEVKLN
jgi:hypothetical protein